MKWEESYQKMLSEILEHPKFGSIESGGYWNRVRLFGE